MIIAARTILVDVAVHLRTRLVEWVFSAILGMFAFRLLATGDTFGSSPSYAYMAMWMSECAWGAVIGCIAGLRLLALTLNGSIAWFRPWSPIVRAGTAWMSCSVWSCLALGFYLSNPNATGWGTYGVIFVADLCLSISIAHDAGHAIRTRHARFARKR